MPEHAKTHDFGDQLKVPTINGQEFPYYVSVSPGPMVESLPDGHLHILWVPVLVDGPMPTPPEGRPSGVQIPSEERI